MGMPLPAQTPHPTNSGAHRWKNESAFHGIPTGNPREHSCPDDSNRKTTRTFLLVVSSWELEPIFAVKEAGQWQWSWREGLSHPPGWSKHSLTSDLPGVSLPVGVGCFRAKKPTSRSCCLCSQLAALPSAHSLWIPVFQWLCHWSP